jgi:hypothetical protein
LKLAKKMMMILMRNKWDQNGKMDSKIRLDYHNGGEGHTVEKEILVCCGIVCKKISGWIHR